MKQQELKKLLFYIFTMLVVVLFSACGDDTPDKETASELTLKVNKFIKAVMEDIYLWYDELPDIDINYELDSEEYFYKLLNEEDKWSYITDDIESFSNSLQGVETSYGYSLAFGLISSTGNVFAIIEYVYDNTPASEAGLKRGDIIIKMDNADITTDNYTDLLYASSLSLTLGILDNGTIYTGSSVSMTARELTLDPVLIKKVIEYEGHKIGYLFYAQYIANFNSSLDDAFQYFQDEQITDLVIDLRYNPGGTITAAQNLCSSVAPINVINSNSTLVTYQWNDKYQSYFASDPTKYADYLQINFTNDNAVKLGLTKLHILTGSGTASASELTITGLKPYMDITTIGDTTYGKYTASITFEPEDIYESSSYYSEFDNWGLQPIVFRYANSEGVTDFKEGFEPDILVDDEGLWDAIPLGDMGDPLFKTAIEDITGTQVVALKHAKRNLPDFTIFDRGFSKYDANKRELIIGRNTIKSTIGSIKK